MRAGRTALTLGLFVLSLPSAHALDLEPGSYTALQPGRSALGAYLQHIERNARYVNGDKVSGSAPLDTDVVQIRFARYSGLGGHTVAPGFIAACGRTRAGGGVSALGTASGCADPIVGAVFWALNRPDERTYLAASPYLSVPIGHYDKDRALNQGENRWKAGINAGLIYPLSAKVLLDLIGDVLWHGPNRAYLGGNRLDQEPIFNAQAHLRYQVDRETRFSVSYLHDWGGETRVNGASQNNPRNQGRFRIGGAKFVTPADQLQMEAGADTRVENGYKESLRVILRYVRLW